MKYGWLSVVSTLVACSPPIILEDTGGDSDSPADSTGSPCAGDGCDSGGPSVPPNPSTTTPGNPTTTTAGPTSATSPTGLDDSSGGTMAFCADQLDCASGYCLSFSDAPPDENAVCESPPAGGATRVTGTVRSISTQVSAPGVSVAVASAIDAAINPFGVTPFAEGVTDNAGMVDVTSSGPLSAAIGVVAIAQREGFALTLTGVASEIPGGDYGPGNDVHDIWLVSTADLEQWNDLMASDVAAMPYLPVGEQGGLVGLVRAPDGSPVEGAVVASSSPDSAAVIRYVAPGDVVGGATTSTGVFIVLNPALAETFTASGPTGETSFVAGSAAGVVFAAAPILP